MVLFSEKVKVAHLALIGAILIPQLHHKGTDKKHPGPSLNLIFSLSGSREWLTSCLKTKSCLHLLFYLLLIKERRDLRLEELNEWGSDSRWSAEPRQGYGNTNQMSLIRSVSGPPDRFLPIKRVLNHTVIAFVVVWQHWTFWLPELFIDGAVPHYIANVTF